MNKISNIEQRVMANVSLIYAGRILLSNTALKLYALVLSVIGIATFVSVSNVISNFVNSSQAGAGGMFFFTVSAVLGTTLVVQVALAVAAASALSLVVPVLRGRASFA